MLPGFAGARKLSRRNLLFATNGLTRLEDAYSGGCPYGHLVQCGINNLVGVDATGTVSLQTHRHFTNAHKTLFRYMSKVGVQESQRASRPEGSLESHFHSDLLYRDCQVFQIPLKYTLPS